MVTSPLAISSKNNSHRGLSGEGRGARRGGPDGPDRLSRSQPPISTRGDRRPAGIRVPGGPFRSRSGPGRVGLEVQRLVSFHPPPADIAEDHLEFTFTVPIVFNKWPAGETLNTDMTTGEERALNAKLRSICRGC